MKKPLIIILIILAVLVIAFLIWKSPSQKQTNLETVALTSTQMITRLNIEQFSEKIKNPDVVVIDIRTPAEYESGHIDGAINLDYYNQNFAVELNSLDKTKSYAIYCRSGNRSASALNMMKDMGFMDVADLQGGIQSMR